MKENKRGITLIALIISIIVMLILVGVTVTVALNGGLFEKARMAKNRTNNQKIFEELNIITAEFNADLYANPEMYDFNYNDDIEEYILEQAKIRILGKDNENENSSIEGYLNDEETGNLYIVFKYKGINAKWKLIANENILEYIELILNGISIIESGDTPGVMIGENVKEIKEGVPIPKGFYYVTGSINTGVVISDNQTDENNENGNNGNQFVWVPVKTNLRLRILVDDKKAISKVTIMNLDGYKEEIEVKGDTCFEKIVSLNRNNVYEVAVDYIDGTKEEHLYLTELQYEQMSKLMYVFNLAAIEAGGIDNVPNWIIEENDLQAEDFEYKIDVLKECLKDNEGNPIVWTTTNDETPEKASVMKYGGFYIGRYEVGIDGTTKKGNDPKTGISYTEAKETAENNYTNDNQYGVKATLPSGAVWNSTAIWLSKSSGISWEEVFIDSGDWGNYRESSNDDETLAKCGAYSKNRICDLAGNLQEWTKESEEENEKICRGGSYKNRIDIVSKSMMSSESYEANNSDVYTGYRLILYIKD